MAITQYKNGYHTTSPFEYRTSPVFRWLLYILVLMLPPFEINIGQVLGCLCLLTFTLLLLTGQRARLIRSSICSIRLSLGCIWRPSTSFNIWTKFDLDMSGFRIPTVIRGFSDSSANCAWRNLWTALEHSFFNVDVDTFKQRCQPRSRAFVIKS